MKRLRKPLITILALSIIFSLLMINVSAGSIAYGAGTVNATALNVRTAPNTSGSIIKAVGQGTIVVILDKTNDTWYHINCNGTVGYVAARYLTEVTTVQNFSATGFLVGSNIRMRSAPSTSASILGTYGNGLKMAVLGINNGWYKVQYGGKTGYVRSDYMAIVASASVPSLGQQIADFAKQYVGYRYVYGAESPAEGFDCSGLVYYTYGHFGYGLYRTAADQYKYNGFAVSKASLRPGDLVFFSSNGGASVTHVGIYIGNNEFVHAANETAGVIISSLGSSYYTSVYYGAKRIVS